VRLLAAAVVAMWAGVGCTRLGDELTPRLPDAAAADAFVIEPDAGVDAPDAADADAADAADGGDPADAGTPDAGSAPDAASPDALVAAAPVAAQQC
jgi:hypothetical protein